MEDHHQHTAAGTSFPSRARSPYERLAEAVAARNDVITRHARELTDAQKVVDDAMTAVKRASTAPTRRRGRSS